ncbi:hypothetical protein [Mucilaginibacter sp. 22184]|uniref:hypothetical protein n=1 Tax=Mucilaginibacter sp. 22184 TaxID=3453887 RepID=UPI003F87A04B
MLLKKLFVAIILLALYSKAHSQVKLQLKISHADNNVINGIGVTYVLPEGYGDSKDKIILLFDKLTPLQRTSDTVCDLNAKDNSGPVKFHQVKSKTINGNDYDCIQADRSITGPLQISYRVPLANPIPAQSGPVRDLQAAGDGISGSFGGFLLLPYTDKAMEIQLDWESPGTADAVCSYGPGKSIKFQTTFGDLLEAQFLAGTLSSFTSTDHPRGFSMYGLGKGSDSEFKAAANWAAKAHQVIRDSLEGSSEKPFYYFFRSYNGPPLSSGRATSGSFVLYVPTGISLNDEDIKSLSAHEMIHVFVADLYDPDGLADWYVEGIADYLSVKLLYDAGLISEKRYLELRNGELAEYYTNRLRNVPNQKIPQIMWSGRNAWTTPYTRGALYFADLEGKLRQHRIKNVSVLSLIREMNRLKASGLQTTEQTWIELIKKRAGDWAVNDFKLMMAGRLLIPVNNAYGENFKRKSVTTQFFDLGFDKPQAIKAGEVIARLNPKSPAALAGLKNGDTIASATNLIPAYESYTNAVTITVKRSGIDLPITFKPRTGRTTGYKWFSITAVSAKHLRRH